MLLGIANGNLILEQDDGAIQSVPIKSLLQVKGNWGQIYMAELIDDITSDNELHQYCGLVKFYPSLRILNRATVLAIFK